MRRTGSWWSRCRAATGRRDGVLVRALSDEVPVLLVVLTKADAALQPGAAGARSDVPSGIEPLRRRAFDRVVAALGPKVRRAPCIIVAAEAVLDPRPELSTLADHFYATIAAPEERFQGERTVVIARREALRLRAGVAAVSRAQAREEELSRARLTRLESNRIPDPTDFRRQLLDRLDGSIDQGADHVLTSAIDALRTAIERPAAVRGRTDLVEFGARRSRCLHRGHRRKRSGGYRVGARADGRDRRSRIARGDRAPAGVGDRGDPFPLSADPAARGRGPAPVASELTREDLEQELLVAQPFGGAMEAFEKQRVGLGLAELPPALRSARSSHQASGRAIRN